MTNFSSLKNILDDVKCDGIVFHPLQLNDLNDFSERKTFSSDMEAPFQYSQSQFFWRILKFLELIIGFF